MSGYNTDIRRRVKTNQQKQTDIEIGARIQAMIRLRKSNQAKLAKSIGVSTDTMSSYVRGVISIPANRINDMCNVLGCDANYLINGNEDIRIQTGLDEDACRMLTDVDEWKIVHRYKGESMQDFRSRKKCMVIEVGETLSWLINHGLLAILADMHAIQCAWAKETGDITFDEVSGLAHKFTTFTDAEPGDNDRNYQSQIQNYHDFIIAEKAVERALEQYVDKSSRNE